jgi:glycosyltransferase involved in cell wall biosynthesis
LVLARLTGVRLITDLRDPWMPHDATGSESTWSGTVRAKAWLERRLVAGSDEIITTADRYTSFLQARHPRIPPSQFHTITNGYDEDDFAELGAIPSDPAFTLSYLGTFYWKRTPRPLLAALSRLVRRGAIPRDLLRLKFIGTVARAEGESVSDLVREFDLEGCVSVRGVIPYHDALVEMRRAAVLVLMAPEAQFYGIPAKTFEYIGSRRPILCLGHRGATADVVRRAGAGLVVDPQDVSAIAAAIERLFCTWRAGQTVVSADDRSRFARSRLTRSLVDVLERRA